MGARRVAYRCHRSVQAKCSRQAASRDKQNGGAESVGRVALFENFYLALLFSFQWARDE